LKKIKEQKEKPLSNMLEAEIHFEYIFWIAEMNYLFLFQEFVVLK